MENPNYYAIIPANVRYDKDLKPAEKLLYGEITSLSQKDGYCFAGNTYFADLYSVTKETVSRWISHLQDCGYLKVDLVKNLNGAVEMRRIIIFESPQKVLTEKSRVLTKKSIGYCEKSQGGIDKKVKDNNTRVNNTSINNITPISPFEKYADGNEELLTALKDYEKMRKSIKSPLTERAEKILINKLDELSNGDDELKIKLLDKAIMHNWKSVYPLKDEDKPDKYDLPVVTLETVKQMDNQNFRTVEQLKNMTLEEMFQ